ncbi:MAG TPA: hypothetical protein VG815_08265, partial [Chloroflexota bacterium]|nr:hypothetical protein [Chloroflexota bacterium]
MKRIPFQLIAGIALVIVGESMILVRDAPISDFYFPVVWSGYVLTVDALLDWLGGPSLWKSAPAAMLWMIPASA